MKSDQMWKLAFWLTALATVVAGLFLIGTVMAPDGCLDQGGSFDYERWECSQEMHEHVALPARLLWALGGFLGLVLVLVGLRRQVRAAQQRVEEATR